MALIEDDINLLNEFAEQEFDLDAYKKSYAKYKPIGAITTLFVFIVFCVFIDKDPKRLEIAHAIGSLIGMVMIVYLPAALIALLLGMIVDKRVSYKGRYIRWFWICSVWFSGFFLIMFLINVWLILK